MIENIKIKTRSTAADYEFLGRVNEDWTKQYRKHFFNDSSASALSLFGVISNRQWKVFLGRIPSLNRDSQTRQLSYIIQAEGVCGNSDSNLLAKLLTFILTEDRDMKKVGKIFSDEFTLEYLDSIDDKRHTIGTESEVNSKLENVFNTIDVQLSGNGFNPDGLSFDYVSTENIGKLCYLISKITDSDISFDTNLLFAATDLPLEVSEFDSIFDLSQNADGLVLTTYDKDTDKLPVIKKKTTRSKSRLMTEFPKKLKNGWTKIQKILTSLLIISLITNFILIFSRSSENTERMSSLMAKQDSLSLLKSTLANYADSLNKTKKSLDSVKTLQCYKDKNNKNIVTLDLAEFSKTGVCKMLYAKNSDTVSVYSIVDFAKNSCKVSVCKGKVSKGGADVNLK